MRITRRTVLAGGVAAMASRASKAQSFDTEVVIVGAGAAACGAARELARRGLGFIIVEARDRVGGRVFTDRSLGHPFDAGAQFIHWSATNPWRDIAREVGIEAQPENSASPFTVTRLGQPLPESDRLRRRAAFASFWAQMRVAETMRGDRSFAQLVEGQPPEMRSAAEGISLLSLGEDLEHISVADYAQLWGGDDLIVRDGYGALVARALSVFPVRMATPARRLRWDGVGVEVETPAGSIRAAAAIVTVSVGVLQAEAIRFEPALPAETLAALDGLRMGALTKIALAFDGDRLGLGESELFDMGGRPGQLMSTGAWENNRDLMVAMLGGDYARGLIAQGEEAAVAHALDRIVAIVGGEARKHFRGGRLAGWAADPFARGSYALAKPGRLAAREALARPVGERIWIAGEATAGPGAMTAGGATLAGERAAREIAALARKKG